MYFLQMPPRGAKWHLQKKGGYSTLNIARKVAQETKPGKPATCRPRVGHMSITERRKPVSVLSLALGVCFNSFIQLSSRTDSPAPNFLFTCINRAWLDGGVSVPIS